MDSGRGVFASGFASLLGVEGVAVFLPADLPAGSRCRPVSASGVDEGEGVIETLQERPYMPFDDSEGGSGPLVANGVEVDNVAAGDFRFVA